MTDARVTHTMKDILGDDLHDDVPSCTEIDEMSPPEIIKLAIKHKLLTMRNSFQMKRELKALATKARAETGYSSGIPREEFVDLIQRVTSQDKPRRELLNKFVIKINNLRSKLLTELSDELTEDEIEIMKEVEKVPVLTPLAEVTSHCPIFIMGESSTGKSSFINLLLGQPLLPTSLQSNTSAVVRIRSSFHSTSVVSNIPFPVPNGCRRYAQIFDYSGTLIYEIRDDSCSDGMGHVSQFAELIRPYLECKRDRAQAQCHLAIIYSDSNILKDGLEIIDSPGFGELSHFDDRVKEFMRQACGFIYVLKKTIPVGSTETGGMFRYMQDVRLLFPNCHNGSVLFILNMWDEFSQEISFAKNNRRQAYDFMLSQLRRCWPNLSPDRLLTISTLDALHIQKRRLESEDMNKVFRAIHRLWITSLQNIAYDAYNLIMRNLKTIMCIVQRLLLSTKWDNLRDQCEHLNEKLITLHNRVMDASHKSEQLIERSRSSALTNLIKSLDPKQLPQTDFSRLLNDYMFRIPESGPMSVDLKIIENDAISAIEVWLRDLLARWDHFKYEQAENFNIQKLESSTCSNESQMYGDKQFVQLRNGICDLFSECLENLQEERDIKMALEREEHKLLTKVNIRLVQNECKPYFKWFQKSESNIAKYLSDRQTYLGNVALKLLTLYQETHNNVLQSYIDAQLNRAIRLKSCMVQFARTKIQLVTEERSQMIKFKRSRDIVESGLYLVAWQARHVFNDLSRLALFHHLQLDEETSGSPLTDLYIDDVEDLDKGVIKMVLQGNFGECKSMMTNVILNSSQLVLVSIKLPSKILHLNKMNMKSDGNKSTDTDERSPPVMSAASGTTLTNNAGFLIVRRNTEAKKSVDNVIRELNEYKKIMRNPVSSIVHLLRCVRPVVDDYLNIYEDSLLFIVEPIRCSLAVWATEQRNQAKTLHHKGCSNSVLLEIWEYWIIRVMKQVVSGLKYLHNQHMVHGELSVHSIGVNTKNEIKLLNITSINRTSPINIDFENRSIDYLLAICRYPPELLNPAAHKKFSTSNKPRVSRMSLSEFEMDDSVKDQISFPDRLPAWDISCEMYSLGMVLYEAMSGVVPFLEIICNREDSISEISKYFNYIVSSDDNRPHSSSVFFTNTKLAKLFYLLMTKCWKTVPQWRIDLDTFEKELDDLFHSASNK